jgi:site-specific DNA-methyltransferase (adenine-specific)
MVGVYELKEVITALEMSLYKDSQAVNRLGYDGDGMSEVKLILGDCLEEMPKLADKSIDMILCDLPYGTTACKWDTIIPFEPLWEQYKRIIKDNGAIVLTASQPFTSALVMSNIKMFKYEWIWNKVKPSGFQIAKYCPMKQHENVLVFSKNTPKYIPITTPRKTIRVNKKNYSKGLSNPLSRFIEKDRVYSVYLPKSIIEFSNADQTNKLHPTQKPVALFEYLIKTYTNEGDLVLDNCAGSGTAGVACKNLNRNCILIEKEPKYFAIAKKRIENAQSQGRLFV